MVTPLSLSTEAIPMFIDWCRELIARTRSLLGRGRVCSLESAECASVTVNAHSTMFQPAKVGRRPEIAVTYLPFTSI